MTYNDLVELFIDEEIIDQGLTSFQMRQFRKWLNDNYNGVTPHLASLHLQTYCTASKTPGKVSYVLGCEGKGRAAVWYVAEAKDAKRMLQHRIRCAIRETRNDIARRATPAAAKDPTTIATIAALEQSIAAQFNVMAVMLGVTP